MLCESWSDDERSSGAAFPLGDGARAWFAHVVNLAPSVEELVGDVRERATALMVEQIERALHWIPSAAYRGGEWLSGEWHVNPPAFARLLRAAVETAKREDAARHDAPFCSSLDVWLRADAASALASPGVRGGG